MLKEQDRTEEAAKQPTQAPSQSDRKPYVAPKLTTHGGLDQITAGSGAKPMVFCGHSL